MVQAPIKDNALEKMLSWTKVVARLEMIERGQKIGAGHKFSRRTNFSVEEEKLIRADFFSTDVFFRKSKHRVAQNVGN